MKHLFVLVLLIITLSSCMKQPQADSAKSAEVKEAVCVDPVCAITLQPYDKHSEQIAYRLQEIIANKINEEAGVLVTDVQVNPVMPLSKELRNKAGSRYRADLIIRSQIPDVKNTNMVVIGLTESDISTTVHGRQDWGIVGLSYLHRNVCVISTYRMNNVDADMWKVVVHEFCHAFLGLPHCPKHDKTCIMCDCNGKPSFSGKNHLCHYCKYGV